GDDEEDNTKIFWEDFDDGEHFPGQLDRYYAPIANKFDSSVDNLRVTSDDTEILQIQEIGIIEEQKGYGFATIKTGQKTGTVNLHVDMKGWGFGSNSTEIINPIKPASTKIFSPSGGDKIFFNNEGTSELVVVTLDPQGRGTSTDTDIEYIIRPANNIVSIPPDSTYDTITIHSSMFGNLIKETEEENKLAKEEALLDGAEEPEEKDAVASINAFSVGSPERPELEITQNFILESSPTTISVSLPFSHIALRGIEEKQNIGILQITDHFGNSIPVSRDIQVNLTSSDNNIIEVPAIIRIPQGESFVKFPITTKGNDGEVTIHAESSGIKFDSEFTASTNSYSTRLSLFISPPEEQQLEVGKQYELLAFVDDEFGESMPEAEVIFIGTNLEFFPTETVTDEFGAATALMTVTEDVPDMLPSVQVIATKPGYVDDDTVIDFEIKILEQQGETVLGMPPWMLGVLIAGIAGGGGGIAFFFLRKTKTDEEQEEADDHALSGKVVHTTILPNPYHYGGTSCIFLRSDFKCALQVAAEANQEHKWR
ncbi:MAG: hypothetical protein ACE5RC_08500, partial [Nitrosopumilus sp.]